MQFVSASFIEANLPYLTLAAAVAGSLVLCLGMSFQIQRLLYALAMHRQRVEILEGQLNGSSEPGGRPAPFARGQIRQEVLRLHGLGRSPEDIAREVGARKAEVEFVLKVNEHLQLPASTMAVRKIS